MWLTLSIHFLISIWISVLMQSRSKRHLSISSKLKHWTRQWVINVTSTHSRYVSSLNFYKQIWCFRSFHYWLIKQDSFLFSCRQVVTAQKQLTIYELPNLLIVQLKRFDLMHGKSSQLSFHLSFSQSLILFLHVICCLYSPWHALWTSFFRFDCKWTIQEVWRSTNQLYLQKNWTSM
jgi:hypothetical protein